MRIYLCRKLKEKSTEGLLVVPGIRPFYTLELPWKDNQPDVSCIPAAIYTCRKFVSKKPSINGFTWQLENVPGRAGVEFHPGNTTNDTLGCILIGYYMLGPVLQGPSRAAFNEFREELLDYETFELEIDQC